MNNVGDGKHAVGLAEMISSLRMELEKAQQLGDDSKIKFEVEQVDLELKVNVEKASEGGGKAGVKFWVVNAELAGKGTGKEVTTHTIKLSLTAKDLADLDENGQPRKTTVRG